jgi:23S rRNA (guanosine2251-2'-O)-methyltransferase
MAGNSQRKGATRKGSRKGATTGSGGQRKQGLEGKGPTPKAKDRAHHPAARKAKRQAATKPKSTRSPATGDVVIGRNPVLEALRAGVPATSLYLQVRADPDDRWRESISLAQQAGIPVFEGSRSDLDELAHHGNHQGLVLGIQDYEYAGIDDVATGNLLVMLDGVTDTHNVGAIARSAAAFGASGMVLPSRRSAGVTASAWKASAGALSRLPVARVTNLRSALEDLHADGWMSVGLDAKTEISLTDLEDSVVTDRLVLVVGSEGQGLSRLVAETCDFLVRIPMVREQESLNASVAAGIALSSIFARR